jgi:hypothetical protein
VDVLIPETTASPEQEREAPGGFEINTYDPLSFETFLPRKEEERSSLTTA